MKLFFDPRSRSDRAQRAINHSRRTRMPPQTARGAPGEIAFSFGQLLGSAMSEPLGLNELLVKNPAVA